MAIPFLIIGIAALATVTVIGAFWEEIKEFLIKATNYFKENILPALIIGFKTFIQSGNINTAIVRLIEKCFHRDEKGLINETVITREVSLDELPEDIRAAIERSNGKEVDITQQVSEVLELEHS